MEPWEQDCHSIPGSTSSIEASRTVLNGGLFCPLFQRLDSECSLGISKLKLLGCPTLYVKYFHQSCLKSTFLLFHFYFLVASHSATLSILWRILVLGQILSFVCCKWALIPDGWAYCQAQVPNLLASTLHFLLAFLYGIHLPTIYSSSFLCNMSPKASFIGY